MQNTSAKIAISYNSANLERLPAFQFGGVITVGLRIVLGFIMGTVWFLLRPYLLPHLRVEELQGLPEYQSIPAEVLLGVWQRWDALHHLNLARLGYQNLSEAESVFYPLYAGLVWLFTPLVGGDYTLGGLVVATLAAWATFSCLRWLAEFHFGTAAGVWSGIALAIYPTALFLIAPFTEGIFLFCTLACFISAYQRRWWLAGILGGLASLARGPGILTGGALLWIAWEQWKTTTDKSLRFKVSLLGGLALPALFGLGFIAWRYSMGFAPINEVLQQYSGLVMLNPISGLIIAITQWVKFHNLQMTLDVFSTLYFGGWIIAMVVNPRWRKPEWLIYCGLNMFVFTSKASFIASSLQSMSRYVLVLFPVFIVTGDWLSRCQPKTRFIYLVVSSALLVLISALYVLWVFVG